MPQGWKFPPDFERQSLIALESALKYASGYESWRSLDPGVSHSVDQRYAALPALTKNDIRRHLPQGFVPSTCNPQAGFASGEISLVKTSGTTDVSVTNIWNQTWWNASEKASWKLNSYAARLATGSHPEAILANPLNVGILSDDVDLPMEKRRLDRFLYLNEKSNPAKWTPALMDRMLRELEIFRPVILEANPSLIARLCRYITATGQKIYQPGLIVFTYEYPSQLHMKQIQRVFDCPLAGSYGTTETGYVFMQCEAGKFHQNTEFCRVDFEPFKPEHGGPDVGRILVTTFNNPWYYMLRFDVADLVHLDEDVTCACGRNSGIILSAVEGRSAGVTLTCTGKLVTLRRVDEAVSKIEGIDQYQLDQLAECDYELHLVTRRPDKPQLEFEAGDILRKIYGSTARVKIIYEDDLSPEASGKYCLAKALFPIDIEKYLVKG